MAASASMRIAASLRERITSGELPPGARLPSTRALVQRHGIAMATATKILTGLRQEGLIRSVPGVGSVVTGDDSATSRTRREPARRRGQADAALGRDRIVAAGIAVADSDGLAGLSMRRVAAELGVAPMSLYRHVTDKDQLLLAMMDEAIGEVALPHVDGGWRDAAESAARTLWQSFRRHPWLAPALSLTRPQALPNALAFSEWVLGGLEGLGLGPVRTFTVYLTLFSFVRGTAMNLEMEAEAEASSGRSRHEWNAQVEPQLVRMVSEGALPAFGKVIDSGFSLDLEELFELGLRCFSTACRVSRTARRPHHRRVTGR